MRKKIGSLNPADLLTLIRLLAAPLLTLTQPFSAAFRALYLLCGVSDLLDGPLARRLHCATPHGAWLDSIADLVFVSAGLYTLLPALDVPVWLWSVCALIVCLRLGNLLTGYLLHRRFIMLHTFANRAVGVLLFALPMVIAYVPLRIYGAVLFLPAVYAAVQEHFLIKKGRRE